MQAGWEKTCFPHSDQWFPGGHQPVFSPVCLDPEVNSGVLCSYVGLKFKLTRTFRCHSISQSMFSVEFWICFWMFFLRKVSNGQNRISEFSRHKTGKSSRLKIARIIRFIVCGISSRTFSLLLGIKVRHRSSSHSSRRIKLHVASQNRSGDVVIGAHSPNCDATQSKILSDVAQQRAHFAALIGNMAEIGMCGIRRRSSSAAADCRV